MREYIFAGESVTEGHPDKMADQISDAILDYIIERDKMARVACETVVTNGICLITGELKTSIYAPMQDIARDVIREIGYTDASFGFDYRSAGVLNAIGEQSIDINQGVDKTSGELGAGDQPKGGYPVMRLNWVWGYWPLVGLEELKGRLYWPNFPN